MTERTFVLAISDDDKSPEKDVNEDQSQPSSVISSSLSSKDNTSPENPADEVVGRYGTDTVSYGLYTIITIIVFWGGVGKKFILMT